MPRRDAEWSPFDLVPFPCIRCGRIGVPVAVFSFLAGASERTFGCRLCDTEHYVSVSRKKSGRLVITYDRYTRRYALEEYDEGLPLTVVTMHAGVSPAAKPDGDVPFGPILVYPRKRRFSVTEVRRIWTSSRGRCHICNKQWALSKRGRSGWHIDHVVPHIGGGSDTEVITNFLVACAKCNLQKGRGYRPSSIEPSIRQLRWYLERYSSAARSHEIDCN